MRDNVEALHFHDPFLNFLYTSDTELAVQPPVRRAVVDPSGVVLVEVDASLRPVRVVKVPGPVLTVD